MLRVEIAVLRDKADRLCGAYSGLAAGDLGGSDVLAAVLAWLDRAGTALDAADTDLGEALRPALRLSLTDAAADERERLLDLLAGTEAGADLLR